MILLFSLSPKVAKNHNVVLTQAIDADNVVPKTL